MSSALELNGNDLIVIIMMITTNVRKMDRNVACKAAVKQTKARQQIYDLFIA